MPSVSEDQNPQVTLMSKDQAWSICVYTKEKVRFSLWYVSNCLSLNIRIDLEETPKEAYILAQCILEKFYVLFRTQ